MDLSNELLLVTGFDSKRTQLQQRYSSHMQKTSGGVYLGGAAGIGAAVCRLAADRGAAVVIADINLDGAKEVAASLARPERHAAVQVDVASSDSVAALFAAVQERFGRLPAGLAHCAAVLRNLHGLEGCTEAVFDETLAVNLKGTFLICREMALRLRRERLPGAIVTISSITVTGMWEMPAYTASKGGVEALSKALANELGPDKIRVNIVQPGPIDTSMGADVAAATEPGIVARLQADLLSRMPIPRLGRPEEVAETILFLVSEQSSYMTGAVVPVNGGLPASSPRTVPAQPTQT